MNLRGEFVGMAQGMVLAGLAWAGMAGAQMSSSPADRNAVGGCDLVVHVEGLRNARGKVGTTVFNSQDGWPEKNEKSFRHGPSNIEATPQGLESTKIWKGLPPGDYAVAAIHDENENHKLDRNFFGLPTEGFGFANNPHVGLSAPSFQKSVVHLSCPSTETTIHLQYR